MITWLLMPAWGCPPTAEEVNKARLAFEDAEVESAQAVLQAAVKDLGCQIQVVDRAVLLELYRLDALVALSSMDTKAAVYSTIRAVAVDPSSAPPPEYGPELTRLHTTWSERLRTATATLSVQGAAPSGSMARRSAAAPSSRCRRESTWCRSRPTRDSPPRSRMSSAMVCWTQELLPHRPPFPCPRRPTLFSPWSH